MLNSFVPFFGGTKSILVCETDGFSLSGAIVKLADKQVKVLHLASVEHVSMEESLAELLALLKDDGWKGGGSAVLLSPAVLSTLVELPVDPQKKRPLPHMISLVAHEVELLLIQHMTLWSIGNLLVGKGFLTEEQAQTVVDMQQNSQSADLSSQEQFSFRRFGELAEELGYIEKEQLSACLQNQEWLQGDDHPIECDWAPQRSVEDFPGTFQWLVSCVSQPLLQRWASLFSLHGIKLKAMYPLTGCSTVLLPDKKESQLILEAHAGQAMIMQQKDGKIAQQNYYSNPAASPLSLCLESYHAIQTQGHEPVWLACGQGIGQDLVKDLQNALSVGVYLFPDEKIHPPLSPGMLGVANHQLKRNACPICVGVRVGGPLPPLMQRAEVRTMLLFGILSVLLMVAEASLWLRQNSSEHEFYEKKQQLESINEASKLVKAQIKEIKKVKNKLKEKLTEQTQLKAILHFYNKAVPERVSMMLNLVGALQNAVNDESIIFSLIETENTVVTNNRMIKAQAVMDRLVEAESFELKAWALNESAAQALIQRLQNEVDMSHLHVFDSQVISGKGPLGLEGVKVKVRVVRQLPVSSLLKRIN